MQSHVRSILLGLVTTSLFTCAAETSRAQLGQGDDLGLGQRRPRLAFGNEEGVTRLDTPDFVLKLDKDSQTVAALEPKSAPDFDFTPSDRRKLRSADGFNHLGDLTLRVRSGGSGEWRSISTAAARKPVTPVTQNAETKPGDLAAADLAPTLPADSPLKVIRRWRIEDGRLALLFELTNKTERPLEIGALGLPMIFNNHLTGRTLKEAHEKCSFFDPYIGADAGYLQVTRLKGSGPALVVVPDVKTPFEGWQTLKEPDKPGEVQPNQTFEGSFEWIVHTKAYAENEWKNVSPWNAPTSRTLAPGETAKYGIRFLLAPEIRKIDDTLAANGRPVAIGIPGFVLPMDLDGRLFIKSKGRVTSVAAEPARAIEVRNDAATKGGWQAYTLKGKTWGRSRLMVTYDNGDRQAIHYYVIKPMTDAVADLGHFLFTKQWFDEPDGPFHRGPSVISYDREKNAFVKQDGRVWIAGLGDEGGAGSWLAAAMKEYGQPNRDELEKYEQFIDKTLWGGIQVTEGERMYAVRKSLFFYEPTELPPGFYDSKIDWSSWTSWNRKGSVEAFDRSFNYPHVVAAYWSMYRLARNNEGLVKGHPWDWYLERAYRTVPAMMKFARNYTRFGQMEGDVFISVLRDLKREGWNDKAADLESIMKARADRWREQEYPFGSEMPWDSTGQEEVYAWCKYFGYDDKSLVSLNSVLGYMPTMPHWGYDGCARRYWDFLYGGAPGPTSRYERQLHHYGSGINAIPVLSEYRDHPEDLYLLRVGYAGTMGALTNIDQEGFGSVAFHSFPDTLKWDAYSGDYGPNFFGHAHNIATYIVNHPEFGWQAYGGNVSTSGGRVTVKPLDSFRKRVYLAPYGLYLTLDAGKFESVEIDTATNSIRVGLAPASGFTPNARLRIEQPGKLSTAGKYAPPESFKSEREAVVAPLGAQTTWVELKAGR